MAHACQTKTAILQRHTKEYEGVLCAFFPANVENIQSAARTSRSNSTVTAPMMQKVCSV